MSEKNLKEKKHAGFKIPSGEPGNREAEYPQ